MHITNENGIERFTLKRREELARNLSDGEKTAIAFSFFITELLSIDNFKNSIIYIDDPISSLDNNHIFQVNALLKDFFFEIMDIDGNNKLILKCKQLFISTHNFNFFNLLKELPKSKSVKKNYYQIRKINSNNSTLESMDKALKNYNSEYHYLFSKLYEYHLLEDKSDYNSLMSIPNLVRRFVELYTYSRLPTNDSTSVDNRATVLWGAENAKRILKVLNYFSHSNNIERMMSNSDLICDIEYAISDLVSLLKKDSLHYNELLKSIK